MTTVIQHVDKSGPSKTFDAGQVELSIWKNDGKSGAFYNVTFKRRFEVDGQWKDGHSYTFSQLANVIITATQALAWMERQERDSTK